MKIIEVQPLSIRWDQGGSSSWVRIRTDSGLTGYGEASPMYGGHASLQVIADCRDWLIGRDPLDQQVIQDHLFFKMAKLGPDGAMAAALAALDIALWDIRGKAMGMPIHKLLGGAHRPVLPFYASIGGNGVRTVDEVLKAVESWLDLKPSLIKIRFDADRTRRDVDLPGDMAKARAVRQLVGDSIGLSFDANNGYSVQGAIRVGRLLEELEYVWFEEPVQPFHTQSFEKVAGALDIPVAAGEQEYTLQGIGRLIDAGVGIVQPDIVKTGGFTGLMQMAALARTYGVDLVPHQTQPLIGMVANLHLVSTLLHGHHPVESNERPGRQHAAVANPPIPMDGAYELPTGPGLGLEFVESEIERRITVWG
ncbi:MAG: mandelate racemase/muconate lactonizing enzyme family protein [Phycisphaeraceae bacterium]|nr:mandelate racemase/muconate lactonizing enzyme family protein [Phycisphaeraceae bacterium]